MATLELLIDVIAPFSLLSNPLLLNRSLKRRMPFFLLPGIP
jgi:hypothetical protein